jgi:hypothetical protein
MTTLMTLRDSIEKLDSDTKLLLKDYMSKSEQLDCILTLLTREYCANCPRNADYGCCDFVHEAVKELPDEAIRLQEVECLENGGNLKEEGGICRYHSSSGCCLRLMKSSSCLGHLCDDLKEKLRQEFSEVAEPFILAMRKLVLGSLAQHPTTLLSDMDESIALGNELLDKATDTE